MNNLRNTLIAILVSVGLLGCAIAPTPPTNPLEIRRCNMNVKLGLRLYNAKEHVTERELIAALTHQKKQKQYRELITLIHTSYQADSISTLRKDVLHDCYRKNN